MIAFQLTSNDTSRVGHPTDEQNSSTMDSVPDGVIIDADVEFGDNEPYQSKIPGLVDLLNPITLTIVGIATLVGVVCIVVLLWLWVKKLRQKTFMDTPFSNTDEAKTTNSAPVSRSASPKLSKQKSCPASLSIISCRNHTVKSECIPEITVTSEHVQPGIPYYSTGPAFFLGNDQTNCSTINHYHLYSFPEDTELQNQEIPLGRLKFSVLYDVAMETLQVNLIRAEHLPGRNNNSDRRDPYVKIFLLPDDKTCRVSKVMKKTLNPVFNESHTFQVRAEDIQKRVLRLSVYDIDKRRVRHSLGHVVVGLKHLDLTGADVIQAQLEPTIRTATSNGELQISLLHIPSYEKMIVTIHNARNLHRLENYPGMGAYIRIHLFYGNKCHRIKQTAVRQGGAEIIFNETLTFTLSGKLLETCNLRISFMLTSSTVSMANEIEYSRVILGPFMFARGTELAHWQEMLANPEVASTRWHNLTCLTS
ncbi:unnamed protein product [Candidula unifasciata]|uniref:C2 domain-containing protein n=1 Tax=Candidula unifasciata TaxID=100452 RepID=A0A8S3ZR09_9EUPU|nr:unnamed protein product [Candidula unifasciata]